MAHGRQICVVEDERFRTHEGPDGHPERPERLVAVHEAIEAFRSELVPLPSRLAEPDEILRVHAAQLLSTVERAAARGPGRLDADTYVSPQSFDVALRAAGSAVDIARRVARGESSTGLAALRPPGHHAEADRAMGFCLFNNVAVAARALQAEEGIGKLMILDWDVHHGNGTQHSFEADPSVFYVSTHQYPYYPGTGDFDERGVGKGVDATLNVPMPAGCGDAEYMGVMQRIVVPAARAFRPEMILVSCGFDAHRDDPLASMQVSAVGFHAMATIVRALADELCGGRVVFLLEGGYALSGLREGTTALLEALRAETALPPDPLAGDLDPGTMLRALVARVGDVHGHWIPDLPRI